MKNSILKWAMTAAAALAIVIGLVYNPQPARAVDQATAFANPVAFGVWGSQNLTNAAGLTNITSAIIPAGPGQAQVRYVAIVSDVINAATLVGPLSRVQFSFADPTNAVQVVNLATNAASVNIYANTAMGYNNYSITNGDVLVFRHNVGQPTEIYERVVVSAASATNITLVTASITTQAVGDLVYKMTKDQYLPYVNALLATNSISWSGNSLAVGPYNSPVLVESYGQTNFGIGSVSGEYK